MDRETEIHVLMKNMKRDIWQHFPGYYSNKETKIETKQHATNKSNSIASGKKMANEILVVTFGTIWIWSLQTFQTNLTRNWLLQSQHGIT
ncbi:hypothetical protein TNCT_571221 [Trichonephila clavata]|uniref:Uncharacterized protein n=1 Tax=Trichonephila clavata TaxID=2740835 RepID=A0A8X6M2U0_TRICU|nr:hypothetical protein TNCT_571221 [Trichonephila clavata]